MDFDWDPTKSESNKVKHGISFDEAKALWSDGEAVKIAAQSNDEERYALIGLLNEKHWCCVYTVRGENIRLISCRRAREKEVKLYESA